MASTCTIILYTPSANEIYNDCPYDAINNGTATTRLYFTTKNGTEITTTCPYTIIRNKSNV